MTRTAEFHVDVLHGGVVARVIPSGELDTSTVGVVRAALENAIEGGCADLVLDLRELTFLDTSGVQMMVEIEQVARRSDFKFSIVDSGRLEVQHVLALTGVSHQFARHMP